MLHTPFLRIVLPICAILFAVPHAPSENATPVSFKELGPFLEAEGFAPQHLTYYEDGSVETPVFDSKIAIFAIDTSPSMVNSIKDIIDKKVLTQLMAILENMPNLQGFVFLDCGGTIIYQSKRPRSGQGKLLLVDDIAKAMEALVRWPRRGFFKWGKLMATVTRLHTRHFEAEAIDLFVLGEDYYYNPREPETQLKDIKLAQQLRQQPWLKINVVRVRDTFNRTFPSDEFFTINTAFDRYGQFLAYSTGGAFFYYDPPEHRLTIEGTVLAKLGAEFPGLKWSLANNADLDVKTLNAAFISGKAVTYDLLVDPTGKHANALDPNFPTVELQVKRIESNRAHCQIKCQSADGIEVVIFNAKLCQIRNRWLVYEWSERKDATTPESVRFEVWGRKK